MWWVVRSVTRRQAVHPRVPRTTNHAVLLALVLSACAGDGRTPLVVYSPHGRDLLTLFEQQFEQLRPDVDVRWLDMGTQEIYDRVRSERANPQGDVWFGGSTQVFAQAAGDSLLEPFRPGWADAVAARDRHPADLYTAVYETPVVIAFARDAVSQAEAPRDWDDLLLPRWRGHILIRDPLASGTLRAAWGLIIERGLRATGDTAAGFAWLRRLDAQTKEYVQNAALLDDKIVRQEGLVTIWDLPDILLSIEHGLPLGYTFPASGTAVIPDPIAVIRGARHGDAARAFVDYIGSPDAQLLAARRVYRLPARLDIPADSLPEWARAVRRDMVVADLDWDLLARDGPGWMRWWDQTVRARGGR